MDQAYKISDFAKQIGKHANTIDNWFKLLEERGLHYVNRIDNEKVYDNFDLQIAQYINEKRSNKWALEAICNELPEQFELRPFPPDLEPTNALQTIDMEALKNRFSEEMRMIIEEMAAAQTAELKLQLNDMINEQKERHEEMLRHLPSPRDPEADRQERMNEMLTRRRIERELEKEALHIWYTKPKSERMKRVGMFRKEEERDKRDQFVKEHIDLHYEKLLREQFGLK